MSQINDYQKMVRNFKEYLKEERLNEDASMSRQHFQLIADVIKNLNFTSSNKDFIANRFADALTKTNSGFDKAKFLQASK